jgi:hypothetical protein
MVMEELLHPGRVDNGVVIGVDPHLKGMRAFTVREGEYPSHNRKRTRRSWVIICRNRYPETYPGKIFSGIFSRRKKNNRATQAIIRRNHPKKTPGSVFHPIFSVDRKN